MDTHSASAQANAVNPPGQTALPLALSVIALVIELAGLAAFAMVLLTDR